MGKNFDYHLIFFLRFCFFYFLLKNYNKNRIHSSRGAKDVEILLDGRIIFKGEIAQACGNIIATNDPSAYGEVRIGFFYIDRNDLISLDYFIYD
jgi:hypothetical protein